MKAGMDVPDRPENIVELEHLVNPERKTMLTHVVWWTLKPEAQGRTAVQNAALLKERLEALRGRIPSLKEITVGVEVLGSSTEEAGLVLISRHDNAEGLAAYVNHPEHQAVGVILKELVATRRAIDFLA